jgi:hypothetical protein
MIDNMRGFTNPSGSSWLWANASNAEQTGINFAPESTGFNINFTGPANWIYIAIRRGPMKVPTTGTSVFAPVATTPSGATTITTSFPVDLTITTQRSKTNQSATWVFDRLRGSTRTSSVRMRTDRAEDESSSSSNGIGYDSNTSIVDNIINPLLGVTSSEIYWNFRRAPGFFDEVCYTGTGVARTVAHNLAAVPELMIVKSRNAAFNWTVYHNYLGATKSIILNSASSTPLVSDTRWNNTEPTDTVFSVKDNAITNGSGYNYVAYLFSSVYGVSKVGSYIGNGSSQTIDCGFNNGVRFVLIKRVSGDEGDWIVFDSARGIVPGVDPRLTLNTTDAESSTNDIINQDSTGFSVTSTTFANATGDAYIFLAIA